VVKKIKHSDIYCNFHSECCIKYSVHAVTRERPIQKFLLSAGWLVRDDDLF
jgi:hypothetical protein